MKGKPRDRNDNDSVWKGQSFVVPTVEHEWLLESWGGYNDYLYQYGDVKRTTNACRIGCH